MQVCTSITNHLSHSSRLYKTVSLPTFQEQMSGVQILSESKEEGCWRNCTKWIMKLRKKIKISKGSLYLAISYLARLVRVGFTLSEENWERVAATLVLISAKMNEIYPPKMSSLINRCSKPISKHQLTLTQSEILEFFNFQMTFSEISYSYLVRSLICEGEQKRDDGEKLLGLAVTELDIIRLGEETIALGVVYLIKPSLVREWNHSYLHIVKNAANKIYNLYISNKNNCKT